ncbi:DUF1311 domain-containing protein (plasmid) [Rhizobium sp. NIBRBAC000502774]|nr:DUF1311 domain-containing protein [Rhizobium sp. NIBRBAC000502774]
MSIGKQIYFPVLLMIAAGGFAPLARAEGINCAEAQTSNAKAICADPDLRALDARVTTVYSRLLKELDPESAKALRKDQRWYNTARDLRTEFRGGRVEKEDLSDSLQFPREVSRIHHRSARFLGYLAGGRMLLAPSLLKKHLKSA